jgi:capsular polysaccharide biosynthesis protein
VNIAKFKTYRNLYNTLVRKSKNRYFEENLNANVKNPKKSWELLKEVTIGTKQNKKIQKISVNGEQISDSLLIAEEFNSFFTNIGKTISDSVRPTSVDPIIRI